MFAKEFVMPIFKDGERIFTEIERKCPLYKFGKYLKSPPNHYGITKIDIDNKLYLYSDWQDPEPLYLNDEVAFCSQPTKNKKQNRKHNVYCVPLIMPELFEFLQKRPNYLEEVRNLPKNTDFIFHGTLSHISRFKLKKISEKLNGDFCFDPQNIFDLKIQNDKLKIEETLDIFFRKMSTAKFSFCPRGFGSTSFRLFESFMVGTIPIVTDMLDYPFDDHINWDSMCVRGTMREIEDLIQKTKTIDYETFKKNAIYYWDNYCEHNNLYKQMQRIIRSHNVSK